MYYNLTEEEYKESLSSFKKTFIGKQLYYEYIVAFIMGCMLFGVSGGIIGFKSINGPFEITLLELTLFVVGSFSLIESVIRNIKFKDELKQYIIEKNKKTKE